MAKRIALDEPDRIGTWMAERQNATWERGQGQAFGVLENDEIIAGVAFDDWDGSSLHVHVVGVPGKLWATKKFLRLCFTYIFCQLNCKKAIGLVGSNNKAAQRFDEHLGFMLEATLEAAHPDGSLLVYSMTKEQCRWL